MITTTSGLPLVTALGTYDSQHPGWWYLADQRWGTPGEPHGGCYWCGFGRTGTASLKAALEHMIDIPGFGLDMWRQPVMRALIGSREEIGP